MKIGRMCLVDVPRTRTYLSLCIQACPQIKQSGKKSHTKCFPYVTATSKPMGEPGSPAHPHLAQVGLKAENREQFVFTLQDCILVILFCPRKKVDSRISIQFLKIIIGTNKCFQLTLALLRN